MRFSIELRYSFDGKRQEIPEADATFLQQPNPWNTRHKTFLERSLKVGSFAFAIAKTAMQIRKIYDWITIKSFRSDKTIFQLAMEREKSEEFKRLVLTGELMQQLNEKFKDVSEQLQCSENAPINEAALSTVANISITSLTMMGHGEPISIVIEGDDNNPEIDHDALARILLHENVGDKPIALFSIGGAFRKGKSFMLNLFLRYLKNREYKYPDWMGDRDKPLDDGFPWKGGVDSHTVGVVMWSEPFIVDKNGEEIAVFLLDTQGNFDNDMGMEQSTKIFALSLLLSSVFIFNVHLQVQNDDLQYLQFTAEYSTVAKEQEEKISLFQNLFFLVRDWPNLNDFDYGLEGGNEYLEKRVFRKKQKSKNTTTEQTQQYLKDAFAAIHCYLMPEPGKKVRICRKGQIFSGCLEDIDKEFLDHVENLADVLLKPENLVIKKGMNARGLMYFIIGCCNAIKNNKNGKLPIPATLMEVAANAMATDLLMACLEKYRESMDEESSKEAFVAWVDFDQKEQTIRKKIQDHFYEGLKFGGNSVKKQQAENLVGELARAKKKFVLGNQLKEMRDRSHTTERGVFLSETYKKDFLKVFEDIRSFNDESILEKTHSELLENAMKLFGDATEKHSKDRKFEEEQITKEQIEDCYELMKLRYSYKWDTLEQIMQQIVCESVKIYEDDINKGLKALKSLAYSGEKVEFERLHVKADSKAKSYFDDHKQAAPECMHSTRLQQLEQILENSKQDFLDEISKEEKKSGGMKSSLDVEDAEAVATSELLKIKSKVAENIFEDIEEKRQLLWEEEELEKCLESRRENLLNEMVKGERDWYYTENHKGRHYTTEVEEFIRRAFLLIKKNNARNKTRNQLVLELEVLEITLLYHESMEKELKGAYMDPKALEEMHDHWIKSQNFRNTPGLTEKAYEIHKQRIVEKLDAHFVEFKEWNKKNKTVFSRIKGACASIGVGGTVAAGAAAGGLAKFGIVGMGTAAAIGGTATGGAIFGGLAVAGIASSVARKTSQYRTKQHFSKAKAKLTEEIQKKKA